MSSHCSQAIWPFILHLTLFALTLQQQAHVDCVVAVTCTTASAYAATLVDHASYSTASLMMQTLIVVVTYTDMLGIQQLLLTGQ